MDSGWIRLHRKLLDWEWFKEPNMVHFFIYLILSANHKDTKWKGIDVKRGQIVTGLQAMSEATGLSVQNIRTILIRLKSTSEITDKSTNKGRIITICNYDTYNISQSTVQQANQQAIQQAANKQLTTNNNIKNNKESINSDSGAQAPPPLPRKTLDEKIAERKIREGKFGSMLIPFVEEYGKEMIRSFFNYWTEPNKSGTKMRYENQETWDLSRRLSNWSKRDKEFSKGPVQVDKPIQQVKTAEQILAERKLKAHG